MTKKEYKKEVSIKIEGKEWKDAIDKAFEQKVKEVSVAGFRKGKTPRDIYEKKYGVESLYQAAVDNLVAEAYYKGIDESKVRPALEPTINVKSLSAKGVEFIITIVPVPEIKVNKYKDLNVKKEKVSVSKDEIEHEISHLLEKYVEVASKKDGVIANGDIAIIDFEGFKDKVAFDGGKAENYELEIGSGMFIPGFEEKLVGVKKGEEKTIKLTFPKEYHAADLAGEKVEFKVKVNDVKEKKQRDFDDELFEDLAIKGVKSKKELEDYVKEEISKRKEKDVEEKYITSLLTEIGKNIELDIPEEIIEARTEEDLKMFEQRIGQQGMNLELFLSLSNMKEEDLKDKLRTEVEVGLTNSLMLEEIIKLEKIKVSEKELDKEVESICKEYNMDKEETLKDMATINKIKDSLLINKALEKIKELNK